MPYYHIWFTTKYREATLEGNIEKKAKDSFLEVAHNKNYNILQMGTNIDHVHMLIEAKNKQELANIARILKCVSAKKILEDTKKSTPHLPSFAKASEGRRVGNTRSDEGYHTRKRVEERSHFWGRRYGCREIDESEIEEIRNYIRDQKKMLYTS